MATRREFEAMTAEEQIEYAMGESRKWKQLAREVQAKQNFKTQAVINTEITSRLSETFKQAR